MSIRKIDEIVKMGSHPLEEHFDIESGSTEIVTKKRSTELNKYELYDEKDKELEDDYQLIMDGALDLVDKVKEHIEGGAEAKFLARLVEVAGQQLNVALSAAEKKAKLKDNKDKFEHKKTNGTSGKTVNNNILITTDRNELLKMLTQNNNNDIIDVEAVEVEQKQNKE